MVGLLWRPNSFGPGVTFDAAGNPVVIPADTGPNPNHPRRYDFDVAVRDRNHPITRGLPARFAVQSEQLTYGQHGPERSEEHTSELQSLMRISYAVFCLKKKIKTQK